MKYLTYLAIFGVAIVACGGGGAPAGGAAPTTPPAHGEHEEHHGKKGAGPVKPPGEAKVGETTKCPVSGEEFVVEATSPKVEHNGKTYYFCCSGCKKRFESEPGKFLHES